MVGTSRQHLIRIEKGIHRPRPELLGRIAEATGTPLDDFEPSDDDEESDVVGVLMRALRQFVRDEVRAGA